jgi:hypothetical protein
VAAAKRGLLSASGALSARRDEDHVARACAPLKDQRDAAVSKRERAFVMRPELNAVDGSLDRRAGDLDDERVKRLEGPREGAFRKDANSAVVNALEAHAIRPHQQHRVVPAQALHPHADAGIFGQMDRQRRFDAIVDPMTPAVDDHAFAAVLRDSKGLGKAGGEDADRVDPGSTPEVAGRIRPS